MNTEFLAARLELPLDEITLWPAHASRTTRTCACGRLVHYPVDRVPERVQCDLCRVGSLLVMADGTPARIHMIDLDDLDTPLGRMRAGKEPMFSSDLTTRESELQDAGDDDETQPHATCRTDPPAEPDDPNGDQDLDDVAAEYAETAGRG